MSRLIKKPIELPDGVAVEVADNRLIISGAKGKKEMPILPMVKIELGDKEIKIENTNPKNSANAGTMYSLVKNSIEGVTDGFVKYLELEGVGYKANMEGPTLVLALGFVNPIKIAPPTGIVISIEDKNAIKISGTDKELVGRVAAQIRGWKKPEPYKGKGIHYRGEVIRRKVGKKAGATTAG